MDSESNSMPSSMKVFDAMDLPSNSTCLEPSTMSGSFSRSSRRNIDSESLFPHLGCVLCVKNPGQFRLSYIIDKSESRGLEQLYLAKKYHLVSENFDCNSGVNGIRLCPSCHLSWMTPKGNAYLTPVWFVPCKQICKYLLQKLKSNDSTTVDEILEKLEQGDDPDAHEALAFRDHYQLLSTITSSTERRYIIAPYLPEPKYYVPPSNELTVGQPPEGNTIYRIFSSSEFTDKDISGTTSWIHLDRHPSHNPTGYHTDGSRMYWKIPGRSTGAFLAYVLASSIFFDNEMCEPELVQLIEYIRGKYGVTQSRQEGGHDGDTHGKGGGGMKRARSDGDGDGSGDGSGYGGGSQSRKKQARLDRDEIEKWQSKNACISNSDIQDNHNFQVKGKKEQINQPKWAPRPENERPPQGYPEDENGWFWGPGWTSNEIILERTNISNPRPWL